MDNFLEIDEPGAGLLVDILKVLNTLNDEIRLFFTPEGIKHSSMDPGHISLIDVNIPARFFTFYRFDEDHAVTFNLKDALRQLRTVNKKSSLTVVLEEGRILFMIRDGSRVVDKRVPILEDLVTETPIPNIAFRARAQITTTALKETLKDLQLIGANMSLQITAEVLHFGASDGYLSADGEFERGADDLLFIAADEPSVSVFTTDYLLNIVNTLSKVTEAVEIQISNDTPIKVTTKDLNDVKLDYYLAPCQGQGHAEPLGAEAVKWIPRPTLIYHPGDTPEPIAELIAETVPLLVEPSAEAAEPETVELELIARAIRTPEEYLEFLHEEMNRLSTGELNMDQYLAELDQVRAQLAF